MKQVSGYTLSTCPWCKKTKEFFTEHGIQFNYIDYDLQSPDKQQEIEADMNKRDGTMAFPWVMIGNEVVAGWNPEKYAELLGLAKQPVAMP